MQMGENGKHRWKISIYRSSSSSSSKPKMKEPPKEFLCPISWSLMFDPVVVASGQTFERTSVQVCRELGFSPVLPDGSKADISTLIPNLALKSTILRWCDSCSYEHPSAPDSFSIEGLVRSLMAPSRDEEKIRVSERDLLSGVTEKPLVVFSHAATELNPRAHHFYSSSSEESVIGNLPGTPVLPFTTRPLCYSTSSSPSTSSDISPEETLNPNSTNSTSEDEQFAAKMKSSDVCEQEQGVISLRKITRTKEESRISLCTPRLLSAVKPLLISRYSTVQTNAAAAVVNLSLEKSNKVKIVRSGIVPPLIDLLKGGSAESQEHAAGALFSLALEDDNKTAIGVLGALQPLLHALRSESERNRHDSAMALYHLSLVQSNRAKLVKLGAVPTLLAAARGGGGEMATRTLLVLCNLSACPEGRSAMLDAGTVGCLVGMLRKGSELVSESTRENCVAALFSLSHGNLRFKGLAREARAAEVLREVAERGSERAREKAKGMLMMLTGRDGNDEESDEPDWEGVMSGELSQTRYRVGRHIGIAGPNSTEF